MLRAVKIAPVVKRVEVGLPVEAPIRLNTDGMGRWWPLASHSVGEEQAETCSFEGWVGGRMVEVMKDGGRPECEEGIGCGGRPASSIPPVEEPPRRLGLPQACNR